MEGQPTEPSCPTCNYSLKGLPAAGRCPECGCSYNDRILSARSARPVGGWASVLAAPFALLLVMPLFPHLGLPADCVVSLLIVGWMLHVSKRIAAWRYEIRVRAFLRGSRPKPVYSRLMILYLAMAIQLFLMFVIWTVFHLT